jgi:hypothetical protein
VFAFINKNGFDGPLTKDAFFFCSHSGISLSPVPGKFKGHASNKMSKLALFVISTVCIKTGVGVIARNCMESATAWSHRTVCIKTRVGVIARDWEACSVTISIVCSSTQI